MPENLKIDTPIGEITIPYSEEAILNFYTKLVKASEGDPNLLEEAFVEYMDLSSPMMPFRIGCFGKILGHQLTFMILWVGLKRISV